MSQKRQMNIVINCLTLMSEIIMHNASMIEKIQAALLSLESIPVVFSGSRIHPA
jgi:hypothetical protein